MKVFSDYGLPDIIHSDQGRKFESSILRQTLEAFGVAKSRTTAYHPQGDGMVERFNRSLLQMLRAYVQDQADLTGSATFHWSFMRSTPAEESLVTRHRHDLSMLTIQYGCPFPPQEGWILTGRESGGYMLFQDQ